MPRRGLDAEQVLDAALVLADEGLERVTLAGVAAMLGVRPPSLYNHVESRAALLRAIKLRALADLGEAIATASAGLAGEDALMATAGAYRAYALAHPGSYEALVSAPDPNDAELRAAAQRLFDLLAAILRGWNLRDERAVDAIRLVRSALHGFVSLERSGAFALPRAADDSFSALVETLALGLASWGRAGA